MKLKSFTLVEVLIVIVITLVVILTGFSFLKIAFKQSSNEIKVKSEDSYIFNQLFQLRTDFIYSNKASFSNNILILKKSLQDSVIYNIQRDYYLRHQKNKVDTVRVKIQVEYVNNVLSQKLSLNLVDKLYFTYLYKKKTYQLYLRKVYSSQQMVSIISD